MILTGGPALGVYFAVSMKKRVEELRQIERIMNYLEAEIRYKNSLMKEAFYSASIRYGQPFNAWLRKMSIMLSEESDKDFSLIWQISLNELKDATHLKNDDIREISNFGQALGYPDIRSMEKGIELEKENIHNCISGLDKDLMENMKVSVILGIMGGIFLVILLV